MKTTTVQVSELSGAPVQDGAVISDCGTYRYRLTRAGDIAASDKPALWIMLNPSTADASLDDPTIRRCRSFSNAWGCSGFTVANLYALRATDPKELWKCDDPVGPENDAYLVDLARSHGWIVCAWGANAKADRVMQVAKVLHEVGASLYCLGTTKSGAPRHPLYIKSSQELVHWTPEAHS